MTVTLPEGKTCNLIAKCRDTLQAGKLSIREVAGLIGMLQATCFANRHAALFLKVLEDKSSGTGKVWFRGLTPQQQPGSYQGGEMMMKSVFWWRKPEHPEETTDLRQVTDG